MNFLERLELYMEENNLRQADLVKQCNSNKGYVSGLLNGNRSPNLEFLGELSKISKKTINWWLYGTTDRSGLASLNSLIDHFIARGDIRQDGTFEEDIRSILNTMLEKEIKDKLNK